MNYGSTPPQGHLPQEIYQDLSGRRDGYGIIAAPYQFDRIQPVIVEARDQEGNILSYNPFPGSGVCPLSDLTEMKQQLTELARLNGTAAARMRQAFLRRNLKLG